MNEFPDRKTEAKETGSIEYTWLYSHVMSFRGLKDGVELSAIPSTLSLFEFDISLE